VTAEAYVPTREDRLSFGGWTVGGRGWMCSAGGPAADDGGPAAWGYEYLDQLALEHLYGIR
jgi:hypothetical protein